MVFRFSGGHSGRETPGPIPNPVVKPSNADGTARGIVWESKTLPEYFNFFPLFLGEGMCVGVSPPASLAGGDTPTHAYPHAQAPARQFRSHYC